MELLEGLAQYVEASFLGAGVPHSPSTLQFDPDEVRRRCYAVGHALAVLLDRFDPAWKESLNQREARFLDELLDRALPQGLEPAVLPGEKNVLAAQQAEQAVDRVMRKRRELREGFFDRQGWRLAVTAAGADPLRPQGFDPMNVQALTPGEVLHGRWLKLGNGAGSIEVFGPALTAAAGVHPLFTGVARLVVTGLQEAPEAVETSHSVTVTAKGVQATFRNARVRVINQTMDLLLG